MPLLKSLGNRRTGQQWGITFRWAHDQLGRVEIEKAKASGQDSYEILTDMASNIAPGSDGLIFHPYGGGNGHHYGVPMQGAPSLDWRFITLVTIWSGQYWRV